MPCPGQTGPNDETACKAQCRTTWYSATAKAWEDYANKIINWQQLRTALDAANAALDACMTACEAQQ